MRALLTIAVLATLPAALAAQGTARSDTSSLTARLGVDTVSVERIIRHPSSLEAEVVTRSPRTSLQKHRAAFDAAGNLIVLSMVQVDPANGTELRSTTYTRHGDSLRVVTVAGTERTERNVAAPPEWLPFVDLVHWPFDIALQRMRRTNRAQLDAPMLSGQRISAFPLAFTGGDSATVTHPTRGTMRLTVLPDGAIRTLDAGATTRALIVTRDRNADVPALARDFAARDASGRGVGELSGRGGGESSVLGVHFTLDYGVPLMRGRAIWGSLVRFGALWRTGANRATHFKTDTPLRVGELLVPAGEYTLFSIPEASGGLLIINRQTGQNGQTYDQARDLGRVTMRTRPLRSPVEAFTIRVYEENGHGVLALQWDRTEYYVEFAVERP
jgi:hypothetical protein